VGFAFSLSSLLDFRLWKKKKKKPSKAAERWVVNNLITYLQFFFPPLQKIHHFGNYTITINKN